MPVRGLVFGSFQRQQYFHAAEPRWRELARTARLAVAVADFPEIARAPAGRGSRSRCRSTIRWAASGR